MKTLSAILQLKDHLENYIREKYGRKSTNAIILLNALYRNPFVRIEQVKTICDLSYKAANDLVKQLCEKSILVETTGQNRNRMFAFAPYLALFDKKVI